VLPLTPAGVATERHIVRAYREKLEAVFEEADEAAEYAAGLLSRSKDEAAALLADTTAFEEVLRSRLAKRGGLGYEQPSEDTFPPVDDFIAWVRSCNAIPMITWLDGTSEGEKDPAAILECLAAKGAAALNIIPDRNWNVTDDEQRQVKRANLEAIVKVADAMHLPINVGTEMNKAGLPFVDDLGGDVLSHYRGSFLRGARIMVGQTVLARYAGCSYISARAEAEFADAGARNDFFAAVGALPPLTMDRAVELIDLGEDGAFARLRDDVARVQA
jgi:hypothetical protein